MSLISAIVAVCKSLPILERLFLQVADGIKEAKAKSRYNAKLDHIDAAMRLHGMPNDSRIRQQPAIDETSSVSESRVSRAGLHEGRAENAKINSGNSGRNFKRRKRWFEKHMFLPFELPSSHQPL